MLDDSEAFVDGVDFCLCGAAGGDGLPFAGPKEGAEEPEDEPGDGA